MGKIITFYSYKGGVGRTMALVNVAVMLAQWQCKVLVVDWDLEAPGVEYYFYRAIAQNGTTARGGIIDLLGGFFHGQLSLEDASVWRDYVLKIELPDAEGARAIDYLRSGNPDEDYFGKVRNLDIDKFYEANGGNFIEKLRDEWKETYDFVLVDSRTGITDIGGICTIQIPDILVLLFTANYQSLRGVIDVAKRAAEGRKRQPDRFALHCVPIASRMDSTEEFQAYREWLEIMSRELKPLYASWLPASVAIARFIEVTKLPYIPYFSFGEKIAAIEQGTDDSTGLGYAYETLAALLRRGLNDASQLIANRDDYVALKSPDRLEISEDVLARLVAVGEFAETATQKPTFVLGYGSEADKAKLKVVLDLLKESYGAKVEFVNVDVEQEEEIADSE